MPAPGRRADRERGYVLMVFIMFAALLMVSLSTIIPQAAFEGRREKEEELIFRGLQYHRAVQLYFRKFGRYPSSVDDLVETNGIRFLRRRYADPMTKEGEWRLIHVGPDGSFVDAQTSPVAIRPLLPGQPASGATAAQAGAAQEGGSQSGFGQSPGQPAMGLSPISRGAPPSPLPPGLAAQPGQPLEPALLPSASATTNPLMQAGAQAQPQQVPGGTPSAATPQPIAGAQPGSTTGGPQIFGGMAIAGFASLAKGSSIRIWNGYEEYDKWEFIFDFRQDQVAQAALARMGVGQNLPGAQPLQPGAQPALGAQPPPGMQPQPGFPGLQPQPGAPGFQPQPGFPPQPGLQPRPGFPFQPGFPSNPSAPGSPFPNPVGPGLPPPRTR